MPIPLPNTDNTATNIALHNMSISWHSFCSFQVERVTQCHKSIFVNIFQAILSSSLSSSSSISQFIMVYHTLYFPKPSPSTMFMYINSLSPLVFSQFSPDDNPILKIFFSVTISECLIPLTRSKLSMTFNKQTYYMH